MLNYRYIFTLTLLVTLTAILFVSVPISSMTTSTDVLNSSNRNFCKGSKIVIPIDFETIQEALDHAPPGSRILLLEGVYKENVIIRKRVHLVGVYPEAVVIDGGRCGKDTIYIKSDGVIIENITIRNGWSKNDGLWDISGIRISASNVTIRNCIIRDNRLGINIMVGSRNITIENNRFFGDGIFIGNYIGKWHIGKKDFYHRISNNSVNGKPLLYVRDKRDLVLQEDIGSVILVNCSNVSIAGSHFSLTDFPVILAYCNNCRVEGITVSNTDGEIILLNSSSCILKNIKSEKNLVGICLDTGCCNNIVEKNEISGCWMGIEILGESHNNYICNNYIHNNYQGIVIGSFYERWSPKENVIEGNKLCKNFVGISLTKNATFNLIEKNTMVGGLIGIILKHSSYNVITRNIIKRCIIKATFVDCSQNEWYMNYWGRGRVISKVILGLRSIGRIKMPWINLDLKPLWWPI